MCPFFKRIKAVTHQYTLVDFAALKFCLFSLGLLGGTLFSRQLKKYQGPMAAVFSFTYVWLMFRTFFTYWPRADR